ncbi:MAG TPA: CmcI family methyltransferase [Terriglobales bacterium]|nr:CmcI family methyltransferase [Terriglobales bacterium]
MLSVDLEKGEVVWEEHGRRQVYGIGTPEAFALISRAWLRSGWDTKYVYSFTWLGRPIIQLPEDMFRIQEVVCRVKPDVLVETGVAHGGSLVFYANVFQGLGKGRVIGVDVEIRPHNRQAIEAHALAPMITLVEGNSIEAATIERVRSQIGPGESVMVVLDSNHTREHVLGELRAYAPMVSPGCYIVACDGIMRDLAGAPRSQPDWGTNNPQSAVQDFLKERADFCLEDPAFPFNEGTITQRVTYWPNAFLRKTS